MEWAAGGSGEGGRGRAGEEVWGVGRGWRSWCRGIWRPASWWREGVRWCRIGALHGIRSGLQSSPPVLFPRPNCPTKRPSSVAYRPPTGQPRLRYVRRALDDVPVAIKATTTTLDQPVYSDDDDDDSETATRLAIYSPTAATDTRVDAESQRPLHSEEQNISYVRFHFRIHFRGAPHHPRREKKRQTPPDPANRQNPSQKNPPR